MVLIISCRSKANQACQRLTASSRLRALSSLVYAKPRVGPIGRLPLSGQTEPGLQGDVAPVDDDQPKLRLGNMNVPGESQLHL